MERVLTYAEAILEATEQEMTRDPSVIVVGIGVDDFKGTWGTTRDLHLKFGRERVFDTPLAEDGMTGVAIGAALAGMRPIHVHIRMDFLLLAMNQLINIAAKSRYMYGGQVSVPLVVRSVIGRSWGQGAQHSQGLHSFFTHVPGLKVFAPSTPYDAKGALLASIRENDPVVFVEHRLLHSQKGHVPQEPYTVPFGKARILSSGTDITLVGISYMAVECMRAQALLATIGISAEVIDPVSLSPLDMSTILSSVRKTRRLIVVDAAWTSCGMSAEIIARTAENLAELRGVRMQRIGNEPVTCPTTKNLEDLYYPNPEKVALAAFAMIHDGDSSWRPPQLSAPELAQFKGPF